MSNFKKIFGLAGAVMVFTGLAYGQQLNCNQSTQAPQATAFLIRAEGTTEQVADLVLTCTNTGTAATATGATLNVQAFLSAPVTSKVLTGNGITNSEALLLVNAPAGGTTALTNAQIIQGTVSGSSVQFNGVTFPTAVAAGGTVTLTITNIRVNASTVTVGTGAPPPITESVFVSGAAAVAAATNPIQVAFVTPGLLTTKSFKSFTAGTGLFPTNSFTAGTSSGANNFVVCSAINAAGSTVLNVLQVAEGFATAFKSQGSAASNNTVGSEFVNNTETGFVPPSFPATGGSNIATSGTRIKVTFTNVPTGVTIYVPTTVGSTNASNGNNSTASPPVPAGVSNLVLTSSETGSFSAVSAASTSSSIGANLAAITATSGTATAVYEYQGAAGGGSNAVSESFNIPVQAVTTANGVTASSSAIMETVSFAPTGATSNIPNFVVGANSTTPITSSTFNTCTTSLLFPFVTNQLGFDTGIAIANTSTDPFGSNGAAPQAGTCTLNFYGAGAPTPSNVTSPNIPTGTVFTQVLSNVAAGFQGYLIAQCQFQFAHGFAFITDGVGANGGLAEGYLAGVIPDINQKKRSADPSGVASAGTGETLGN